MSELKRLEADFSWVADSATYVDAPGTKIGDTVILFDPVAEKEAEAHAELAGPDFDLVLFRINWKTLREVAKNG